MAEKGDKAKFYDIAMRMYTEGKTLTEIEGTLGVSRQTLAKWKADTKKPSEDLDEWDKARQVKRSYAQRLRALLDRELLALEESGAGGISGGSLDGITKLGTLVQRWEAAEAAAALKDGAMRSALFLDFVRDLIAYAGKNDPGLLVVLEEDFDDIIAWGQDKYGVGA